jgi:hypothetical protein
MADAGTPAHDQHQLARFDLGAPDQHVPCGEKVHGCGCGLLVADRVRNFYHVDFRQADLLSVAAGGRLESPDHPLGAVVFAAAGAGFANPA